MNLLANPTEAAATPAAPLPKVTLKECFVDGDRVVLHFTLSRVADPRNFVATLLREEFDKWKSTAPEWQKFGPFVAMLDEAARDLHAAEASSTAARIAWQDAMRSGGDVAAMERNVKDAQLSVDIIREREKYLKSVENERKVEIEQAWRKRIQDVLNERRRLCDEKSKAARAGLAATLNEFSIITLSEETNMAVLLALGSNGCFGLSPRLF